MATVSILLPSYNAREFLEPRIDSLLRQTFIDWEAIVLDSYSTDGTWEYFQSAAGKDPRFRLHQIPREGLYAALNRGLELTTGEYVHFATADDSMSPEYLQQMVDSLSRCPEAGIAASDVQLINRSGEELSHSDVVGYLSPGASRTLFSLSRVRTAFPDGPAKETNFRPVPHDCLLHFDGRSVYLSLNQLVVRAAAARGAGQFKTSIGSVADFDWLLRLTSQTGTVHVPKKLAMWRFHGNQLSLQADESRANSRLLAAVKTLNGLGETQLLTANDRAALLLPLKLESAGIISRIAGWFESSFRLVRMFCGRPSATFRALRRVGFRFGTRRHTLLPMIFEGLELKPNRVD